MCHHVWLLCSSGASPGQLVRQAAALVLWLLCLPLHAQSPIYPLLVGAICRVAQRAPAGCPHWRLKQHRLIKRWLRSRQGSSHSLQAPQALFFPALSFPALFTPKRRQSSWPPPTRCSSSRQRLRESRPCLPPACEPRLRPWPRCRRSCWRDADACGGTLGHSCWSLAGTPLRDDSRNKRTADVFSILHTIRQHSAASQISLSYLAHCLFRAIGSCSLCCEINASCFSAALRLCTALLHSTWPETMQNQACYRRVKHGRGTVK